MSYGTMLRVSQSRNQQRGGENSQAGNMRQGGGNSMSGDMRYDGGERYGGESMRHHGGEYSPRRDMRYGGMEYSGGEEMAFRDRTGRRHYDNGRFAPMRSAMDDDDDDDRKIGFDLTGDRPHAGWDMDYRDRSREMGRASVYKGKGDSWIVQGQFGGKHGRERPMDEEMAEEWTSQMKNDDGSTGPHWQMDQIKQLIQQKKELQEYEPVEVFAVMNMMYSDYNSVAKKFGLSNMEFYVALSKAWLDDPDAGKNKTAKYYECVVK